MSIIEMASTTKLSYQRLRNESGPVDEDHEIEEGVEEERLNRRARRWFRIKKVVAKKRRKVRIPGLRMLLSRKDEVISAVTVSWTKVYRRLMESRSYMGNLFAGNYLFTQVNPSPPLKCAHKSNNMGLGVHNFTSKSSFGKTS